MVLTKHALKRKRQRGFSSFSLEMIEKYGRYGSASGGLTEIFLGRKESLDLIRELKRDIQLIERLAGSRMLVGGDRVVTVYKTKG
ncbi:MAG TPA: hypothetical protein PK250_07685 [Syntrophobacter fumaroxidans]|nr:hypothetical protein [Syntrophobacter fumaroxidans]